MSMISGEWLALLTAMLGKTPLSTVLSAANAVLQTQVPGRVAFYGRTRRGLDRIAAFAGAETWSDPEMVISPVPHELDVALGDNAQPTDTAGDAWLLGALSGLRAYPAQVSGDVRGLLFADPTDDPEAEGHRLIVAGLLAARVRFEANSQEVERLREEQYEHLLRSETLAATGMLSAGVAHELNNPLGVVVGLAELIALDESLPEPVLHDIKAIIKESTRAVGVVRQLLSYGRGGGLDLEVVDLIEVVEGACLLMESAAVEPAVTLTRRYDSATPLILADPFRLQQSLLAMLDNTRLAFQEAGVLSGEVIITLTDGVGSDDSLILDVQDTGPGLPDDVIPRVFDPFFSTREVGKGTGMGLALAARTIGDIGGEIVAVSNDIGALFRITIPRHWPDA